MKSRGPCTIQRSPGERCVTVPSLAVSSKPSSARSSSASSSASTCTAWRCHIRQGGVPCEGGWMQY
eukprot:1074434-Prymnesium_polylepis.1